MLWGNLVFDSAVDSSHLPTLWCPYFCLAVTPPGYKTEGSSTTECASGSYRADWKPAAQAGSCDLCGDNIESTPTDEITSIDISDYTSTTKVYVRAAASACCKYHSCEELWSSGACVLLLRSACLTASSLMQPPWWLCVQSAAVGLPQTCLLSLASRLAHTDSLCVALSLPALSADIKAGQGMYFSPATSKYTAVNCETNNYGVANTTYGLAAYPCRDCPAGMQTSASLSASAAFKSANGFTSPMACVTKAGYGYNGRVATKCAAGSYNADGNYGTCTQCPVGYSTPDAAASQVAQSDCTIAVGYGFYNNAVIPCPVGESLSLSGGCSHKH